jgi:hypothetical protein
MYLGSEGQSVLGAFDEEKFVQVESWRQLERILRSNGGSYGLSGQRGAGKSWMMNEALCWARKNGGIGVWFPSPSEYEPLAFLAAVSDVTATTFEEHYDEATGRQTRTAREHFLRRLMIALVAGSVGAALWWGSSNRVSIAEYFTTALAIGLLGGAVLTYLWGFMAYVRERRGLGRVRQTAEELRQQVRFVMISRDTTEGSAEASHGPLKAAWKRIEERELAERPATLSSLVHNYRAFCASAAAELEAPFVVAVDELDKMSDGKRLTALLRDIKGIFEIPGVHFLVSLSEEAARSLDLGSIRTRTEFNSSFYAVLDIGPLNPTVSHQLLERRGAKIGRQAAVALSILTAGVPRELVRVAELTQARSVDDVSEVRNAVLVALGEEARAFRAEVMSNVRKSKEGTRLIGDTERLGVHRRWSDETFKNAHAAELYALQALRDWSPRWTTEGWTSLYSEEWRRLLVRISVGGIIVALGEQVLAPHNDETLQRVLQAAADSSVVARDLLLESLIGGPRYLGVDSSLSERQVAIMIQAFISDSVSLRSDDAEAEDLCARGLLARPKDPDGNVYWLSADLAKLVAMAKRTSRHEGLVAPAVVNPDAT